MPLTFTATNTGKVSVTLQLLGREPTVDFRVTDSRGRMIWSLLRGETLMGPLRLFPLDAGKSLTFRHAWNQRADNGKLVPQGEYLVRGVLLTDTPGGLVSPAATLRLTP